MLHIHNLYYLRTIRLTYITSFALYFIRFCVRLQNHSRLRAFLRHLYVIFVNNNIKFSNILYVHMYTCVKTINVLTLILTHLAIKHTYISSHTYIHAAKVGLNPIEVLHRMCFICACASYMHIYTQLHIWNCMYIDESTPVVANVD